MNDLCPVLDIFGQSTHSEMFLHRSSRNTYGMQMYLYLHL